MVTSLLQNPLVLKLEVLAITQVDLCNYISVFLCVHVCIDWLRIVVRHVAWILSLHCVVALFSGSHCHLNTLCRLVDDHVDIFLK